MRRDPETIRRPGEILEALDLAPPPRHGRMLVPMPTCWLRKIGVTLSHG